MNASPARIGSPWALMPLLCFLLIFFGSGLYFHSIGTEFAFYQVKAPVAIIPAIVLALLLGREALSQQVERFLQGVGDSNIIMMCLVFLLAGAFTAVSKAIGGVDATVSLGLQWIPAQWVLPGLFVIAAFIATAMGTSMGTIAAVAPIAIGVAEGASLPLPLTVGAVIGGAMFGDNLSIISDTTIAATRTQGCEMRDKFRLNVLIAAPAALLTIVLLFVLGSAAEVGEPDAVKWWLVLPYLAVLVMALAGINVLVVLFSGILFSGMIGLVQGSFSLSGFANSIYSGYESMLEIMLLSMFIGGLGALMKQQGGLSFLTHWILRFSQRGGLMATRRAGEGAISALVAFSNLFIANNTVAIVLSGGVAKQIAEQHGVDPRRSASLLDIFSCVVQGLLPYGAQILLAASLSGLSPLSLAGSIWYCWLLAAAALLAVVFGVPRVGSPAVSDR
ncbi:Na+/H+ antiporter NhaC family protein [Aestuariirhabdus litorea]|uniref:Na+/H+ antiporter NhaC family protein n=1 Tax=Aestuariirhabdus litorea TaxID=2528527 RepID=A0A3P3VRA6_9GAMM|nr:Na+/H+ antiporter NhaC family protein [Aestuariirhabdus litorea]RRJ84059.1 Na+/H+ antiporter NhaC family protein [Aestuariirhabdus litorea]RWW97279.1 Na+/H+ antiporter NhaC family protein [Endozoicomonadaceae bacterium GTF-13]